MDDRKRIEREYHNKRFTSTIREKADRNYVISTSIKDDYDRLLDSMCRNKTVLEIGCAGGRRICRLAELGNRMTGIDISESAIAQAITTADANRVKDVEFQVMDAENLTFKDDSFNIVYGNGILHHLELEHMFRELNRILSPGGSAIFIEPLGHNILINLYRWMTPSYRTKTEKPLRMSDIRLAKNYFTNVSAKYYYLFTIMAIPFSRMILFQPLVRTLEVIDRVLFTIFPFSRRFAWMVLMILNNPQIKKRGRFTQPKNNA